MKTNGAILRKIVEMTNRKYPGAELYLFGSHARGNARALSDWDILVLLHSEKIPFELETTIMDDMYEIELETGEIISPLIYPKTEWDDKYRHTSLYKNINKEAIRLT
jgi:predicted nucleotidyltransferase